MGEYTAGAGEVAAEATTRTLTTRIADISVASSAWVVSPIHGKVVKVYSVIDGAITVADATLTPKIGGTSMTNGAITVAYSGSAAGDVDSSDPDANNEVAAGEAIEVATDGGSTGSVAAEITLVIAPI
jgi:hypothetical protein